MGERSMARAERQALCDLALALGEDAATLCTGWDAKDLVVHLLVRERSPMAAPGLVLSALSPLTDLEMARVGRRSFRPLVDDLRSPLLTPVAVPVIDKWLNTLEFFVHHEDLRRAQPGWQPRPLGPREQATLWKAIRRTGPALARNAGVPMVIRRSDTAATATLRPGEDPVVVSGPPAEVVLFLYGRDQVRDLAFDGPAEAVAALRAARLGV